MVRFITWIVYDGLRRTKDSHEIDGYFLANRSIPWWAAGISVMATQLSAITMIGTTGQGYNDGLRFIQFYYALPLAMIILSVTLVPFFYNSRVYTAYEYLERRFDGKTRSLTSLLFLISRGMSCGAICCACSMRKRRSRGPFSFATRSKMSSCVRMARSPIACTVMLSSALSAPDTQR